jgi:hypothetical protein
LSGLQVIPLLKPEEIKEDYKKLYGDYKKSLDLSDEEILSHSKRVFEVKHLDLPLSIIFSLIDDLGNAFKM